MIIQKSVKTLAGGRPNLLQLLGNILCIFLLKLNICLPSDPAISLLGIYVTEASTYAYQKHI